MDFSTIIPEIRSDLTKFLEKLRTFENANKVKILTLRNQIELQQHSYRKQG